MIRKIQRILFNLRCRGKNQISIGKNVFIHNQPTFITRGISDTPKIILENNVYIGRFCNLHTSSMIKIGENSVLSDYVYISTLAHGIDPLNGPIMSQPDYDKGPIELGSNTFLGFNSKVMPGVKLGNWTIVGAGSVVTRSYPGYCIIAGNPAKIIKIYHHETNQWVKYDDE
jgi:acetyltransferase-like isoleucine patch superfamily enzyme